MAALRPRAGGLYIDGTLGAGGHAAGILAASAPTGRLLAFDRDPEAIAYCRQRLAAEAERLVFLAASYADMGQLASVHGFAPADGIILDLGLSSRQLEQTERGFSFQRDGPLDMRFDQSRGSTAADLINNLTTEELADLFWRYGEERQSRRLARLIMAHRPLQRTGELADLVARHSPRPTGRRRRRHPATRIFQALRIAVNDELGALEQGLPAAVEVLRPGARLVVISFHSLEDRLVKQFFRRQSQDCICPPEQPVCTCDAAASLRLISRKAIKPGPEEVARNPRSRSARLRAAEKLASASR